MASIDLSAMRLVRVPDSAPPYDCDLHGANCPALRDPARSGTADHAGVPWSADGAAPGFGGLPDPAAGFSGPAYVAELWQPADPADLPGLADIGFPGPTATAGPGSGRGTAPGPVDAAATTAWPRQFAQVMTEILAGVRPVKQIVPWAADHVVAQIRDLIPRFASDRRPRIRRVVTSQPAATAVEITVVAAFGSRTRALAMRFEHVAARPAVPGLPARPARWLCTALEAG